MKKELQEELYKKYPKIFRQKDLPMQQTAMCWGIECGNGWYSLIDQLCTAIQYRVDWQRNDRAREKWYNRALKYALDGKKQFLENYYKHRGYEGETLRIVVERDLEKKQFREVTEYMHQVEFAQVKEKYGTLRVYHNGADDYIHGLVVMAELMSGRTCELCGVPGRSTKGSWIQTLCIRCAKEAGEELISREEDVDE